ncbi:MAG TPA: hypothetical protein PKE26_03815 [Kiritimatiellia bacterium]|nr:hypothetical protein [Kiritimatiellia bacterium]HMO98218.1 hypothetical protein [Kiritimatiellia bacterium]
MDTAAERGWSGLLNGELILQAETDRYDVLITTDKNLKYQQNLSARKISILVLTTTSWPRISKRISAVREALDALRPGGYSEVNI